MPDETKQNKTKPTKTPKLGNLGNGRLFFEVWNLGNNLPHMIPYSESEA
jgi:hypothetical protein